MGSFTHFAMHAQMSMMIRMACIDRVQHNSGLYFTVCHRLQQYGGVMYPCKEGGFLTLLYHPHQTRNLPPAWSWGRMGIL